MYKYFVFLFLVVTTEAFACDGGNDLNADCQKPSNNLIDIPLGVPAGDSLLQAIDQLDVFLGNDKNDFDAIAAFDGDIAAVGLVNAAESSKHHGSTYVFAYADGEWTLKQQLIPSGDKNDLAFGFQLAFINQELVVHAINNEFNGSVQYVFVQTADHWVQKSRQPDNLKPETLPEDNKNLSTADVADFLTQNVCVDTSGNVVKADPYACPAGSTSQDPSLGQPFPYYRIDQQDVQAKVSFEALTQGGEPLWVHTFDWGIREIPADDNDPPTIATNLDGSNARHAYLEATNVYNSPYMYDIVDVALLNQVESPGKDVPIVDWVAFSGTKNHYWIDECSYRGEQGGWLLFPLNTVSEQTGIYVNSLAKSDINDPLCSTWWTESITVWSRGNVTYSNGKELDTIAVIHSCNNDLKIDNDCFEKHYFTKEYGMTRWEQWMGEERIGVVKPPVPNPNSASCNGDWEIANYWRNFCRDFSYVRLLDGTDTWNPRSFSLHKEFGKGNLMVNGDFAYRDFTAWNRLYSTDRPTEWDVIQESQTASIPNNHKMLVSCPNCTGNYRGAVYHDIDVENTFPNSMHWGGELKNESAHTTTVLMRLFQLSGGVVVAFEADTISLSPGDKVSYDEAFTLDPNADKLRWQIFVQNIDATVSIDNAFITEW